MNRIGYLRFYAMLSVDAKFELLSLDKIFR